MKLFIQAAAAVVTAAILGLCLDRQGKDIALVLTVFVCTLVLSAAVVYIKPVMDFAVKLRDWIRIDHTILGTLVKVVGIGMVSEISVMICGDAGRASLGKAVQILSSGVILAVSLPIFSLVLELIDSLLGGV